MSALDEIGKPRISAFWDQRSQVPESHERDKKSGASANFILIINAYAYIFFTKLLRCVRKCERTLGFPLSCRRPRLEENRVIALLVASLSDRRKKFV